MCCYKNTKNNVEKKEKKQPEQFSAKSVPKTSKPTTSKKSSPPKNETTKNNSNEDLNTGLMSSDLELIKKAIGNGANVNHVDEKTKETPI